MCPLPYWLLRITYIVKKRTRLSDKYSFLQPKHLRKESLKTIQAWSGFEPMTSVLYQLSFQANWELVILWVRNIPVKDE